MKWPSLQAFIKARGWSEEEAKRLLLEQFGAGYEENLTPQYITRLQAFYDNSRKGAAQAA
jgi:hypothetical protein